MNLVEKTDMKLPAEMEARMDADYLAFYKQTIENAPTNTDYPYKVVQVSRYSTVTRPGTNEKVPVKEEREIMVPRKHTKADSPVPIQVYFPEEYDGKKKLPVIYSIHGGGWVIGSSTSEAQNSTRLCAGVGAIVISPDYRLAPEHPFPAPVEDCWEVLMWIYEQGPKELSIDLDQFIIGGGSAGANLTEVLLLMVKDIGPKDLKFKLSLLTVPCVDASANTPYIDTSNRITFPSHTENKHGPTLNYLRYAWFLCFYLPNIENRLNWHASPIYAPDELFKDHPPTWMAVSELDLLRDEGLIYAEKLKKFGTKVHVELYEGVGHAWFLQNAGSKKGLKYQDDIVDACKKALSQ